MFQVHTPGNVPGPYMELFPFLLMPVLWENRGNIQPLVRLIQAYVRLGPEQIISLGKIEPLLGIFQKLIASKANDHEGFNLLQTMIEFMPRDLMAKYNQGKEVNYFQFHEIFCCEFFFSNFQFHDFL